MGISTPNEWTETATADNSAATATKTGVSGVAQYITHISASFEVATTSVGKRLDLKDGGSIIMSWWVKDDVGYDFDPPLEITVAADAVLTMAASGNAGDLGAVNMAGFTSAKS